MMGGSAPAFWQGKRVFLTGHTGFKGAWLVLLLLRLGAQVEGYALPPEPSENLYALAKLRDQVPGTLADIGDKAQLIQAVQAARPDVVIHMAAQALVRRSYVEPERTWATNVDGTLHLLQALKTLPRYPLTLIVTTDKVYRNDESGRTFVETDPLGGHDPYSASKAACELLVESWRGSFGTALGARVVTARAGNVIGGGDFAEDRIVPDLWRAMRNDEAPILRNPTATRPWQHVLDCLNGYLLYVEALASDETLPLALNFGPDARNTRSVAEIAGGMLRALGQSDAWATPTTSGPREMVRLALDTTRARKALAWQDHLDAEAILNWTAEWYRTLHEGGDVRGLTLSQIDAFLAQTGRLP